MFFIWVVWDPELFGWVVTVKCLVRTHQVVYEKSSKFVSSKPNQSVLYFYVERIATTLSTVYISALKQTTMIRIIKLDYLRLTRARDDGAVVQDWEEPCHYRISLFRLMGCFKMFDNSMFLHPNWSEQDCWRSGWTPASCRGLHILGEGAFQAGASLSLVILTKFNFCSTIVQLDTAGSNAHCVVFSDYTPGKAMAPASRAHFRSLIR